MDFEDHQFFAVPFPTDCISKNSTQNFALFPSSVYAVTLSNLHQLPMNQFEKHLQMHSVKVIDLYRIDGSCCTI